MIGILFLILLAGLPSPGSAAEIYRCRNAAGNWMFADNPDHFPPDCRPIEKGLPKSSGGGLIIVPGPSETSSDETGRLLQEQALARAQREEKARALKAEADKLAGDFQKAQAERIPSMPPATVTKALKDMLRIERRSAELRRTIEAAPISSDEREAIRSILAPIPPPP